jgi:hypothetical protein
VYEREESYKNLRTQSDSTQTTVKALLEALREEAGASLDSPAPVGQAPIILASGIGRRVRRLERRRVSWPSWAI